MGWTLSVGIGHNLEITFWGKVRHNLWKTQLFWDVSGENMGKGWGKSQQKIRIAKF
jgi:hypothetical protein